MNLKSKLISSIATMSLAAALVGGATFALWTTTASVDNNQMAADTFEISTSLGTGGSGIYPGGTKSFTFTVTNPEQYDLVIDGATLGAVNWTNGLTGMLDNLSVPNTVVQAGQTATITATIHMDSLATDPFQGQTADIDITLHATQQ